MLDLDRFWAVPTEEQLESAYGFPPISAGVTDAKIAAWEKKHNVALPALLRTVLKQQDGGMIRGEDFFMHGLDQIRPADRDLLGYHIDFDDEGAPDPALLFEFAANDLGGQFYLDYSANGPQGEPSIKSFYGDGGSLSDVADSLDEFFGDMLATDDAAGVDWSEADRIEVIASETIDASAAYGAACLLEQILGRTPEGLVLLTRDISPEGETLRRILLPLPLDPAWAEIRDFRPEPIGSYELHLQPADTDGIVSTESRKLDNGSWKNSTSRGVPIYATFESLDRAKLEDLRRTLFGEKAAAEAATREAAQAQWTARMESLPEADQRAGMLSMFMKMQEEVAQAFGPPPDPSELPADLAAASENIQRRLSDALAKAREHIAAHPVDPDTARMIDQVLRSQPRPPLPSSPETD